ncbi:hypothetical protein HanRHA438_Chr10g0430531 [Helianthus annuus]|nr:hypothetical protein HanRHA438_Chr10g0430531 [Helianthus annuus]
MYSFMIDKCIDLINAYPLNVRRWHERPDNSKVFVHLFPAVALHLNMSHPLILQLLLVLTTLGAPALSPANRGGWFWFSW